MNKIADWLNLTDDQRKTALESLEYAEGILPKAAEKDWWVTLTLHALFLGKFKDHLVFKGGTSLSKCFNLIERFSEDIDIVLAPEAVGLKYEGKPSKSFIKKLKREGCEFTSTELKEDLKRMYRELGVPEGMIEIEAQPISPTMPDADPQTLFVHYPSLFDPSEYLINTVRIEVSVRSQSEPRIEAEVRSIVGNNPSSNYSDDPVIVNVIDPQRTFLEKMFLLHEEFLKKDPSKIRILRMSRHLYDLEKIMDSQPGLRALKNKSLYDSIVAHRSIYSAIQGVNYETLRPATLSFLPPESANEAFLRDYQTMCEVMIYGEAIDYDQLLKRLHYLLERVRSNLLNCSRTTLAGQFDIFPHCYLRNAFTVHSN